MSTYDRTNQASGGFDAVRHQLPGRNSKMLSHDEERRLAERIAQGDPEARRVLIESHLRLVARLAQEYLGNGLAADDLIGEGTLGLIRAVESFDPNFGTRFATYACFWIRQSIRLALSTKAGVISVPARMAQWLRRWRQAEAELTVAGRTRPDEDEIGRALGLTLSQQKMLVQAFRADRLRYRGHVEPIDPEQAFEYAVDPAPSPDHAAETDELTRILGEKLESLDPMERTVLEMRFGLRGREALTLREAGDRIGITREWVRRIEMKALGRLFEEVAGETAPDTECRETDRPEHNRRTEIDLPEGVPPRSHLRPRLRRESRSSRPSERVQSLSA